MNLQNNLKISRDVIFKKSEMHRLAMNKESSSGDEVSKETFDLGIDLSNKLTKWRCSS